MAQTKRRDQLLTLVLKLIPRDQYLSSYIPWGYVRGQIGCSIHFPNVHQKVAGFTPSISYYVILQNWTIFVTNCTYVHVPVICKCRCTLFTVGVPFLVRHLVRWHIPRCTLNISMLQMYCFFEHINTSMLRQTLLRVWSNTFVSSPRTLKFPSVFMSPWTYDIQN